MLLASSATQLRLTSTVDRSFPWCLRAKQSPPERNDTGKSLAVVVRIQRSHCWGLGFIAGQGTKTPQGVGPESKENIRKVASIKISYNGELIPE